MAKIEPTSVFKDNVAMLPSIDGLEQIALIQGDGTVAASIENVAGKQGSLAVYHYLKLAFGELNAEAAAHGLLVFAEHSDDARNRPGAHPNVDRLLAIVAGAPALEMRLTMA